MIEPAAFYVDAVLRKQKNRRVLDNDVLRGHVHNTFMNIALEDVLSLTDDENPLDRKLLNIAWQSYTEWRLYRWTHSQIYGKGLSPMTSAIVQEKLRIESLQAACGETSEPHFQLQYTLRMWAMRWRRTCRLRIGCLPTREETDRTIRRENAGLVVSSF